MILLISIAMGKLLSSIVFGDMNTHTRSSQPDTKQSFMTHISRMHEDIQIYSLSAVAEKDLNQFEGLLLQIYNSTGMLITNGVS